MKILLKTAKYKLIYNEYYMTISLPEGNRNITVTF